MKFLLTGFEPFNKNTVNPSWDAVSALPTKFDDNDLVTVCLPVVYDKCWEVLKEAIISHKPDVVICCGLANKRTVISLEKQALNIMDATIPDNAGVLYSGQAIFENGVDSLETSLNLDILFNQLSTSGIPAEISLSAGKYVCNNLYYHLLYNQQKYGYKGLFVHVPDTSVLPIGYISNAILKLISAIFATDYCEKDFLVHVDILEALRSKDLHIVYSGPKGYLSAHTEAYDYFYMSAPNLECARYLCSLLPKEWDCVNTHHLYEIDALNEIAPMACNYKCCLATYQHKELLPLNNNCDIRPLTLENLDYAAMRYHLFRNKDYLAERISEGEMWGAWVDGKLCGFIGLHDEGAMGILEVDPDSRRLHLGTELESWLINYRVSNGAYAYCQIVEGNNASMGLQGRLGLTFSDFQVCWVRRKEKARPIKLSFYSKVYQIVKAIPCGKVATYAQIAEMAGSPKAIRAVGNALHNNPDPNTIPCWRVVSSKGKLSSNYAFGGAQAQASLLKKDGVSISKDTIDLDKFQWRITR